MYEWHLQHYKPGLECSPSMPHSKHNWEKSAVRPDGKYNRSQKWLAREFRLLRSTRIGFFIIHQNVLLIIICRFRLGWKGTSSKACGQNLIWSFNFYCLPSIWADRHFIRKNFPTLLVCRIAISYPSIHIHIHIHIYDIYIYIYHAHTHIYIHTCVYSPQYVKRKRHLYPTLGKTTSWASFAHHFSWARTAWSSQMTRPFLGNLGGYT